MCVLSCSESDENVLFYRTVEEDDSENKGTEKSPVSDAFDEYHFDQYDDEDTKPDAVLSIDDLAVYSSDHGDPYVTLSRNEDDDSEKEDDMINPKDNLILVGHVEGDASILEVYGEFIFITFNKGKCTYMWFIEVLQHTHNKVSLRTLKCHTMETYGTVEV
jgi:hypothetical protein